MALVRNEHADTLGCLKAVINDVEKLVMEHIHRSSSRDKLDCDSLLGAFDAIRAEEAPPFE